MNIHRLVIHELQKEQNGVPNLFLSEMLPPITPHATSLIIQLNEKYKSRETYGRFNTEDNHPFPTHFQTYCDINNVEDVDFLNFSRHAMTALNQQLVNSNAKGGYFLFVDYTTDYGDFFSIFLVRDTEGYIFHREEQPMYDITPQLHIGIEKLAMACKINKAKFRSGAEGNYLSFIRTDRQNTSGYFINWISATQLRRNSEYTDKLVDIIKNIALPEQLDGYAEVNRENLQKVVFEYCSNRPNGTIDLIELSRQLYGEENETQIVDYAHQQDVSIDVSFTPDKAKLKRLYKVKVSSQDISLQFDQSSFNETIRINQEEPNIIVIHSQELANKIRQEMNAAN